MSRYTSASSLHRGLACPAYMVLPHVVEPSGKAADRGTAIHAYIEAVLGGVSEEAALAVVALAKEPEWTETCRRLDWSAMAVPGGCSAFTGGGKPSRSEVTYAFSLRTWTARELGQRLGRNYSAATEEEIVGTADIVGEDADGTPVVADIKTGQRLGPVAFNAQIRFLALCLRLLTGSAWVIGRLLYVAEDGSVEVDEHRFDALELDSFGDELEAMAAKVDAEREMVSETEGYVPTVTAGEHCAYCPATHSCPKNATLARAMLPTLSHLSAKLGAMSPEEQGQAWVKISEIEKLYFLVKDGLKAVARERPIPLPNGQVVRAVYSQRRSLVADRALKMLEAKGLSDEERESLYSVAEVESVKKCGKAKIGRAHV